MEIITQEGQTKDLKEVVNKWIPDRIGRHTEKASQSSICSFCQVIKAQKLKKPKFELGELMVLHGEGRSQFWESSGATGLKVNQWIEMSPQSKHLFKIQTSSGDK